MRLNYFTKFNCTLSAISVHHKTEISVTHVVEKQIEIVILKRLQYESLDDVWVECPASVLAAISAQAWASIPEALMHTTARANTGSLPHACSPSESYRPSL